MRLTRVFARFYKSFNFDHVRKAAGVQRKPWEMMGESWYPYVEVPVDRRITAVVGANESGKSQLLGAIRLATLGEPFRPKDLCRYCDFFGVEEGNRHLPHVGAEWTDLTAQEAERVQKILGSPQRPKSFCLFRFDKGKASLWIDAVETVLNPEQIQAFDEILPKPFTIDPDVALPSAVPLQWLTDGDPVDGITTSRRERRGVFDAVSQLRAIPITTVESIAQNAGMLLPLLNAMTSKVAPDEALSPEQLKLVDDLLFKMARIDRASFKELAQAVVKGDDGYANGLIEKLNQQIARGLNLRRWWVQDREFSLRLSVREHDVVFTIKDRTGTEYTFEERSHGLRYFLSYLIQSQAAREADKPILLLMDEPDAHLSAEAQQDLLRIFDDLVDPRDPTRPPMQVVYVTHSPFLLDKNHAERIRVLEKGRNLDGTRIIRNAAHNHYEPLRSAFGAFLGESAFIGSVNLVVEGSADQILLAGAARCTRRRAPGVQNETLDLNRLVIVPAGSASQIAYMVRLIRGRDADRPPVLVLLDSDRAGAEAAAAMREPKFGKWIAGRFVMQIGETDFDMPAPVEELEDLLPPGLALASANLCLAQVFSYRDEAAPQITQAEVDGFEGPVFDRLEQAVKAKGATLGKVPLARAVVELADPELGASELAGDIDLWLDRMKRLFGRINIQRREAEERTVRNRNAKLVEDRVKMFEADHGFAATREEIDHLLEAIFIQLDDSPEADAIRQIGQEMRTALKLKEDPAAEIADFPATLTRLRQLKDAPQLVKDRMEAKARASAERRSPSRPKTTKAEPAKLAVTSAPSSPNSRKVRARRAKTQTSKSTTAAKKGEASEA